MDDPIVRPRSARFSFVALACLLGLSACAVQAPPGPSLPVMPGDGKTLSQFQQDDLTCRSFAGQQVGISPADAANQAGLGSAAIGTALGAGAGALIGLAAGNPAMGAAIGAGAGLLTGAAAGVNNANASAAEIQQRYDLAYQQCMATTGNKTTIATAPMPAPEPVPAPGAVVAPPPAPVYAYPPPAYYYPYPYYYPAPYAYYYPRYYYPRPYYPYWGGPRFTFYFGGGGGYHNHYHHW